MMLLVHISSLCNAKKECTWELLAMLSSLLLHYQYLESCYSSTDMFCLHTIFPSDFLKETKIFRTYVR